MKNRIQYHMRRIGDEYNFFFKTISPPRPAYMNNKGQKRTSCQLVKIKDGLEFITIAIKNMIKLEK